MSASSLRLRGVVGGQEALSTSHAPPLPGRVLAAHQGTQPARGGRGLGLLQAAARPRGAARLPG